jgi:hypothetical protein
MDSMKILCEVPFKDKTLTELDVSGKDLGMEGALVIAEYLDSNEAMTSLAFGDKQVLTMTAEMTEANFSGKLNKSHEAQIAWAFLPKCT